MKNPGPATAAVASLPETELCGFRLVRIISHNATVTSWVASPSGHGTGHDPEDATPLEGSVTLSRFTEVGAAAIPPAMLSVSSSFLQRALDVATDGSGAVVLITERTHGTLAELFDLRTAVRLGEAVTILAPVAAGIHALHREGYTHGGLSPATVAFTSDGRPLVTLLSDTMSSAPACTEESDLADLRKLISLVLGRSDAAGSEPVEALLRWLERSDAPRLTPDFFTQLDLRLFALAEPAPISFAAESADVRTRAESPVAAFHILRERTREDRGTADAGDRVPRFLAGLGSWAEAVGGFSMSDNLRSRFAGIGGWLARTLRGRAAVLIVGTAVAMVAVWGGLALVPAADTPTNAADRGSNVEPVANVAATNAETTAIESDDPIPALVGLLALRSRCLQSGNDGCLNIVDEPNSAAEATDQHAMDVSGETFLPLPIEPAQAELLQRTGHAALFRVKPGGKESQPVLVLIMKTTTGWRVRDLAVPG
ncbi:hypothetical protein L1277_000835 [Okibacterium sp. HSC-33S16]|uniref:hypothetical protein n=1 Tax=Okibacterium sp. HSC-33S16 TaxID=2910965 RepID=UPI00209C7CBA|nr:hypothetical protein [Okibacterium sp. HSC-33S16]MCP2030771.1 hypothetical protein [Okibacterium sp. HSC-33S16]